jgi:hypothetical protein
MKRNAVRLVLLAGAALPLAACGGAGGVGSTPGPIVAPGPAPSPSPSPSYKTVSELSQNDTVAAAGYKMEVDAVTGDHVYSEFAPGAGYQVAFSNDGSMLKLTYGSRTFDFDLTKPVGTAGERRYDVNDDQGGLLAQVLITDPKVNGVSLSYLNFADLGAMGTDASGHSTFAVAFRAGQVFGSPTLPEDLPTAGSAIYTTSISGVASLISGSTSYRLDDNSTADFTVNFGTGDIATNLHVLGDALDNSGLHDFAVLNGHGTLLAGSSAFSGDFGSALFGRFEGGFFGPGAKEMGYAWFAQTADWEARGFVAGRKN